MSVRESHCCTTTTWQAMLGYAHAAGDVETSGIVDALTRMLE